MVSQFKDNKYNQFRESQSGKSVYDIEKEKSIANFYFSNIIPGLLTALDKTDLIHQNFVQASVNPGKAPRIDNIKNSGQLALIKNELTKLSVNYQTLPQFKNLNDLTFEKYNNDVYKNLQNYLKNLSDKFNQVSIMATKESDNLRLKNKSEIEKLYNSYFNEKLEDIVTKVYEKNRVLEYKNSYVQNYEPIYLDPEKRGFLNFRTHFFAPSKYIFGILTDTFAFNITLVLLSTILFYLMLYYELLGMVVRFFENLRFRK